MKKHRALSIQGSTHCSWTFSSVLLSRWPLWLCMTHQNSDSEVASNKTRTVRVVEDWMAAGGARLQPALNPVSEIAHCAQLLDANNGPRRQFCWSFGSARNVSVEGPKAWIHLYLQLMWPAGLWWGRAGASAFCKYHVRIESKDF